MATSEYIVVKWDEDKQELSVIPARNPDGTAADIPDGYRKVSVETETFEWFSK